MAVRWGLIGAGDIANKRVAAAIQSDADSRLVAVCRRSEGPLHQFADHFAIPQRFTDANELIASPEIDAVYVATPVDCHLRQTLAAARAGKHVLVEKPMALDPDQCAQMIEECERSGVILGVAYYRRYYPVVSRIAQWIGDGTLGRVLSIACVTGNPIRFPPDDWRVDRTRGGGGPLMDIGSHRLDLFLQLIGEIDSVNATMIPSTDYDAEQVATLLVSFRQGAIGILQCYFGTVDTPDRLEIIGTDGRIVVEDLNGGEVELHTSHGTQRESHPPASNVHAPLIADFTASIARRQPFSVCGRIGKKTNDIIRMAYQEVGI